MPNVIVEWSGRCLSRETQSDLCKFVNQIAEISYNFGKKTTPDYLTHSHKSNTKPPEIINFDNQIKGKILLNPNLLQEFSSDMLTTHISPIKDEDTLFFLLKNVNLYGIEFPLYDPRLHFEDRVSFVFLSHNNIPALNGKLVHVENHNGCQYYRIKTIQQADWFLTKPCVSLRYYLENWFDYFLGWVKYFFIQDLHFWRYESFPGYDKLKQKLDKDIKKVKSKEQLKHKVFKDILKEFKSEAESW